MVRLHQEDLCQALSRPPDKKYQSEGGPGIRDCLQVLESSSNPEVDRERFMRLLAFNLVIGGTDAHAKNFSILHGTARRFRLAPAYDLASALPYADEPKLRTAMSIGGKYRLREILPRHWEREAANARYPKDKALAHVREMIATLGDLASSLRDELTNTGHGGPLVDRLANAIQARCHRLRRVYGAEQESREDEDNDPSPGPR